MNILFVKIRFPHATLFTQYKKHKELLFRILSSFLLFFISQSFQYLLQVILQIFPFDISLYFFILFILECLHICISVDCTMCVVCQERGRGKIVIVNDYLFDIFSSSGNLVATSFQKRPQPWSFGGRLNDYYCCVHVQKLVVFSLFHENEIFTQCFALFTNIIVGRDFHI